MSTAIDKASLLAAYVQEINDKEYKYAEPPKLIHVTVNVGRGTAEVEIIRTGLISGEVAIQILQRAKEIGANNFGVRSTGGIYVIFNDA